MALLFGICGACRVDEMVNMIIDDLRDMGPILIVNIPDSKTKKKIIFTITDESIEGMPVLDIYRKYVSVRPMKTVHKRFFLQYNDGKCTNQVIGKNTMAEIPFKIASFLKLENAKQYTGHSFRRTSATLLVNAGGDLLTLKQHGGWSSSMVAEGYIADSISRKCEVASKIISGKINQPKNTMELVPPAASAVNCHGTISGCNSPNRANEQKIMNICSSEKSFDGISFNNLTNCTITFNSHK